MSRVNKGINVKSIDVAKTKIEIKKCPIAVQQYISSLESLVDIQKHTIDKAIKKLKSLDKNELFKALAHGDDDHRDWLKEAIDNFYKGEPIKPVR